jgi:hypothetical protein
MLAWVALLAAGMAVGSAAAPTVSDEAADDPKCARGECRPFSPPPLDEDDPKLARGLVRPRPTTRFEVGYRFFQVANPYGGRLPFHLVELDGYPISGIFRLGLSLTAGGSTRDSGWLADVGLSLGVQYPYRVTPFLDARFSAGFIGANIVGHNEVSYELRPAIEGGLSVFLAGRFHFTAAVGWAHPIYGGVNAKLIEQEMQDGETPKYNIHPVGLDSVTARVSLGF